MSGARGLPATPYYKASLTYAAGFRCTATLMIVGLEAAEKARHVAAAILKRTRRLFAEQGLSDYSGVSTEVLGAESMYGPHARHGATREVVLKIAVAHTQERALELFAREIFPAATSMAQGITGFAAGRPIVQPIVRLASCLVPKSRVHAKVEVQDAHGLHVSAVTAAPAARTATAAVGASAAAPAAAPVTGQLPARGAPRQNVALACLAHGRSGDKGDTVNISVLARRPEFVALLAQVLTAAAVRAHLAHLIEGEVERYDWPGLGGWNFVLRQALGGGGVASLRYDPQGKSYAQILMDLPIEIPAAWAEPGGLLEAAA